MRLTELCIILAIVFIILGGINNETCWIYKQIAQDEATLKAGTFAQQRTVYVFDRGAIYGYKLAQKQLIPVFGKMIQEAVHHRDEYWKLRREKPTTIRKKVRKPLPQYERGK